MTNKVRMVEVWFDEFKEKVYEAAPDLLPLVAHAGDQPRIDLRRNLKCGKFQEYVDRFKSVFLFKRLLPSPSFILREEISGKCLRSSGDKIVASTDCNADDSRAHFWQDGKQLRQEKMCFDANAQISEKEGMPILLFLCHDSSNFNQHWVIESNQIKWGEFCAHFESDEILKLENCGLPEKPPKVKFVIQALNQTSSN